MSKTRRYQFLGWIIEKGLCGFYVLDWDYEGETVAFYAENERKAQDWCLSMSV